MVCDTDWFNMASFVNANLGSDSDSDDYDFDPTKEAGHVVSEEENSGDDEDAESGTKKSKKSKKKSKQGGNVLSRPAKQILSRGSLTCG